MMVRAQDEQAGVLTGTIDDSNPFSEYPLTIESDGSTLTLDMSPASGDLDTLLYLIDSSGVVVAENDDRAEGDYSSLVRYPQAEAGQYTAIATRYGILEGETSGDFELLISIDEEVKSSVEVYMVAPEALEEVGYPPIEPHEPASWTVLVYYGGDTNLESDIMHDFNEFEFAGGSDESVRVIALFDRHIAYEDSGGWYNIRLYEAGSADAAEDERFPFMSPLADFVQTEDMGSGETLAQFLSWAIASYPAEHYAVAFGGHGAGWKGLITDDDAGSAEPIEQDVYGYTILSLPELSLALEAGLAAAEVDKFDLLINDACLMSSIEYYAMAQQYFHRSIASPEIVVSPALDMTLLTETLKTDRNDVMLDTLGVELIDTYITRDVAELVDSVFYTNALTDLDEFDPVLAAVDHFASLIIAEPDVHTPTLALARANTYTYTYFLGYDQMVDLGHFMQEVALLSSDVEVILAAQDVVRALEAARIYGNAGERAAELASYYNIYFPAESRSFDVTYFEESPLQSWGMMLRSYYNNLTPKIWQVTDSLLTYHPPVAPKVTVTQVYPEVVNGVMPPSVSMEVVGRQIASGTFTVDQVQSDGSMVRLAETDIITQLTIGEIVEYVNQWRAGVDKSYFNWMPLTLPVITDGTTSSNELLTYSDDAAILEGRYREPESEEWNDVAVIFNQERRVERVISRKPGTDALASVTITTGAEFQAYRFVVSPDGRVSAEPGTLYAWGELSWSDALTPSGTYNLGFLVKAAGGTTGFDSAAVTVDNDNADPDYYGYIDAALGLSFPYPAAWSAAVDLGDRLLATNAEGTSAINVYYFEAEDDLDSLVAAAATLYSLNLENTTDIEFAGLPAVALDYTYEVQAGEDADATVTWRGRGFALYRDTTLGGVGMVFAAETADATRALMDELYDYLLAHTGLFDSVALYESEESAWEYQYFSEEEDIVYPVRVDWLSGASDDGAWILHTPAEAEDDGYTFAGIAKLEGDDAGVLLDALVTEQLAPLTDYALAEQWTYYAEYRTWESVSYTAARDGQPVAGRLYVTLVDLEPYALWFETVADDDAAQVFRDTFEFMVDGFAPPLNTLYAFGGTDSIYLKAATTAAAAACQDIAIAQVCYGNGTVTATPLAGQAGLGNTGDIIPVNSLEMLEVGINPDASIDPFSVGIMRLQAGTGEDQYMELTIFGGATVVNEENTGGIQSLSVFLAELEEDETTTLNGLLIETSPNVTTATLVINDVEFEMVGGAMFWWQGELTTIDSDTSQERITRLRSMRQPDTWSSTVLKGSVRVRITDPDLVEQVGAPIVVTGTAGTQVKFAPPPPEAVLPPLSLSAVDKDGAARGLAMAASARPGLPPQMLPPETINVLYNAQDQLNNVDMANMQAEMRAVVNPDPFAPLMGRPPRPEAPPPRRDVPPLPSDEPPPAGEELPPPLPGGEPPPNDRPPPPG